MISLPWSRRCECPVFARVCRCVRSFRSGWHPCPTAGNEDNLKQFEDANKKLEKEPGAVTPRLAHFCPQCGQFRDFESGVGKGIFHRSRGRGTAIFPKFQAFEEEA